MTADPGRVAPLLHGRLYHTRLELERLQALAERLARALDLEVEARHGRADPAEVKRETAGALYAARARGLL